MATEPRQQPIEKMANTIAHELRSPLAVINTSIYFLKTKLGPGADAKVAKHLRICDEEVKRGDGLIVQMLEYARPLALSLQPVKVRELVDAAASACKAPDRVDVAVEPSAKDARVKADREKAQGALRRLLDNAVDATAGKGGSVTLKAAAAGAAVEFVVRDTGPGLTPEAKLKLFEPFFSTLTGRLGIGLATARKYAEGHGGSLELVEGGGGAAFKLKLPAV